MRIRGVDVAFGGGHDAIAVGVDDGDGRLVALQQALGQVVLIGLEGGQPLEGVEQGLARDPTGDEALPELPLRRDVGIEEVGVTRSGSRGRSGLSPKATASFLFRLLSPGSSPGTIDCRALISPS